MPYTYRPRGMPARFMADAPEDVRRAIIDIIAIRPAAPLDFDVVFRDTSGGEMAGLDFGTRGERGCHFFLAPHEMRDYRERNQRNRVAWKDLPPDTRNAISDYLRAEVNAA